jgi:hypothetical protein
LPKSGKIEVEARLAVLGERQALIGVTLGSPGCGLPAQSSWEESGHVEAVIFDRLGDRDVLVATKEGLLVVLAPAPDLPHGRCGQQPWAVDAMVS